MKKEQQNPPIIPGDQRPPEVYGKVADTAYRETPEEIEQRKWAQEYTKELLKREREVYGPPSPRVGRPNHLETTYEVKSLYPFTGEGSLGGRGIYIGRNLNGASFCFDPFLLYNEVDHEGKQVLSDPSMVIAGDKGSGKSSFVKTYIARNILFGRHAAIIDPDGEYDKLAEVFGVTPMKIKPFGDIRLNPLDPRIAGIQGLSDEEIIARQSGLLRGIIELMHRGQQLSTEQGAALDLGLRTAYNEARNAGVQTTIPRLVEHLLYPSEDSGREINMRQNHLEQYSRGPALDLRRLLKGDLAGMFDQETSKNIQLDQPLVIADISKIPQEPDAIAIGMAITTSFMQGMWARDDGIQRILAVEESYKVLANENVGVHAQSYWKGGRKKGQQNIAVVQHLEDFSSVGDDGSRSTKLAQSLLADSPTKVIYHQDYTALDHLQATLRLSEMEKIFVSSASRGRALWKVGDSHSFAVEHRRHPMEKIFANTNKGMEGSQVDDIQDSI